MQVKRERSESRYSDTSIIAYSPYGRSLHVLTTRGRHYPYRVPYNWPSNPRAEAAIVYRHSARCAIVTRVVFEINPQPSAAFPVNDGCRGIRAPNDTPSSFGRCQRALCRLMGFPPPINGIKFGQSPIALPFTPLRCKVSSRVIQLRQWADVYTL